MVEAEYRKEVTGTVEARGELEPTWFAFRVCGGIFGFFSTSDMRTRGLAQVWSARCEESPSARRYPSATEMKPAHPVSSFHVHAGNEYRGPGSWKRPRKKHFAINEGPLDLGRILDNLDRQQRSLHKHHAMKNHSKQGKAAALQKRLESLCLALAPSSGVDQSPAVSNPDHHDDAVDDVAPVLTRERNPHHSKDGSLPQVRDQPPQPHQQRQQQHYNHRVPICCANDVLRGVSERGSCCGVDLVGNSSSEQQQIPCASSIAAKEVISLKCGHKSSEDITKPCAPIATSRTPSPATKMSIDDRCTSQILGARTRLRALLTEQKKLGDAMRRRRLEACLGDGGPGSAGTIRKRRVEPAGGTGRRRSARKTSIRNGGGRGRDMWRAEKRCSRAHPLVFMEEVDVQKTELNQMRLEDAEAAQLMK